MLCVIEREGNDKACTAVCYSYNDVASTWAVVGRSVLQDALEDGALAHVPVPVHLERDLGGGPVRLGQGNAQSLAAGPEWGFVESSRETDSTGETELCSESLTAVAFLFALHSVADEETGE